MVACPLVVFWLVRKKQNLRVRSRTRERSLRTVTHQRHELITCGLELRPLPKHLHARAALEKASRLLRRGGRQYYVGASGRQRPDEAVGKAL